MYNNRSVPISSPTIRRRNFSKSGNSLKHKKKTWEYHEPPEHWIPVQFCLDTSLHGLHYIGQRKRHCCERLFWFTAFVGAVTAAGLLIYEMWDTYTNMPIVTVFNPLEKSIDEIPFPSVTICSVNKLQDSKMEDYKTNVFQWKNVNETAFLQNLAALADMENICRAPLSFAKRLVSKTQVKWANYYDEVADDMHENKDAYEKFLNPTKFLVDGAQKCSEMILFCVWQDEVRNCSDLFKEVETDFGYCCTFNTIPLSLIYRFHNDSRDDPAKVREWADAELNYGNILFTHETYDRKYPNRQLYPGRSAGLSVLLEPNLTEYSCTTTDSDGFMVGLNVPLDYPRMEDNAILIRTGTESFINVHPQITTSAESIKKFKLEKRNCYFDGEFELSFYSKYTASNCLAECIGDFTYEDCNCTDFYMPRGPEERMCRPDQYECVKTVKRNLTQTGFAKGCYLCLPTCTEIEYLAEVTALQIRQKHIDRLFSAYNMNTTTSTDVSLVHIYFSQDAVYPRLRKEMYTVIDLISNTGGLLGLCMGFSMLSVLEILYYCTLRLCCIYRRRYLKDSEKQEQLRSELFPNRKTAMPPYYYNYNQTEKQGWFSKLFSGKSQSQPDISQDVVFRMVHNADYGPFQAKPPYSQHPFHYKLHSNQNFYGKL